MQGWRSANEDAHITDIEFVDGYSLMAVFDGHGGAEVAKFCENHFTAELKKDSAFKIAKDSQDQDTKDAKFKESLENVFLKLD